VEYCGSEKNEDVAFEMKLNRLLLRCRVTLTTLLCCCPTLIYQIAEASATISSVCFCKFVFCS
jgi:hypothetical protein